MSVERILKIGETPDQIIAMDYLKQEVGGSYGKIRLLAELIGKRGVQGLQDLEVALKSRGIKISRATGATTGQLNDSETYERFINLSGIIWAAFVPTMEDVVVNGAYSNSDFLTRITSRLDQTSFNIPFRKPQDPSPIVLPNENRHTLTRAAMLDKTFSTFLHPNNFHALLPQQFRDTLSDTATLYALRNYFLPRYSPLAERLLATPNVDSTAVNH